MSLVGPPSRKLWIVAITSSIVCVAALCYALVTDWNAEPTPRSSTGPTPSSGQQGGGFGLGLVIGIGAGVVLGSLLALRKRS